MAGGSNSMITVLAAALALLSLVVSAWNLGADEFVWDDAYLVAGNPALAEPSNIPAFFAHSWAWGTSSELGATKNRAYYRPIAMTSLAADRLVFGLRPWGFRLTSNLIHAGVAVLLFFLALRLGASAVMAAGAAALFALHPIVGEVTSIAAYRTTLLATLFSGLAFYCCAGGGGGKRWLMPMFALAAFLSKETSVVLLALLPLACLAGPGTRGRLKERSFIVPFAVTVALAVAVAAVRSQVTTPSPGAVTAYFSLGDRMLLAAKLGLTYVRTLLVPYPLSAAYDFSVVSPPWGPLDPAVLAGVLVAVVGLVLAGRAATRRRAEGWLVIASFICLAPILHLIPFRVVFADRFLYLPLFFLAAALGLAASRPKNATVRKSTVVVMAVATLLFGGLSVHRYPNFNSTESMLLAEARLFPDSFHAHFDLAGHYRTGGKTEAALVEVEKALEVWPDFGPAVKLRAELVQSKGER